MLRKLPRNAFTYFLLFIFVATTACLEQGNKNLVGSDASQAILGEGEDGAAEVDSANVDVTDVEVDGGATDTELEMDPVTTNIPAPIPKEGEETTTGINALMTALEIDDSEELLTGSFLRSALADAGELVYLLGTEGATGPNQTLVIKNTAGDEEYFESNEKGSFRQLLPEEFLSDEIVLSPEGTVNEDLGPGAESLRINVDDTGEFYHIGISGRDEVINPYAMTVHGDYILLNQFFEGKKQITLRPIIGGLTRVFAESEFLSLMSYNEPEGTKPYILGVNKNQDVVRVSPDESAILYSKPLSLRDNPNAVTVIAPQETGQYVVAFSGIGAEMRKSSLPTRASSLYLVPARLDYHMIQMVLPYDEITFDRQFAWIDGRQLLVFSQVAVPKDYEAGSEDDPIAAAVEAEFIETIGGGSTPAQGSVKRTNAFTIAHVVRIPELVNDLLKSAEEFNAHYEKSFYRINPESEFLFKTDIKVANIAYREGMGRHTSYAVFNFKDINGFQQLAMSDLKTVILKLTSTAADKGPPAVSEDGKFIAYDVRAEATSNIAVSYFPSQGKFWLKPKDPSDTKIYQNHHTPNFSSSYANSMSYFSTNLSQETTVNVTNVGQRVKTQGSIKDFVDDISYDFVEDFFERFRESPDIFESE